MLSNDQLFFSTPSKVLIELIPTLRNLILEIDIHDSSVHQLVTDQQLADALNGPLQFFFKTKLSAFATIAKVRLMLTMSNEDVFKENQLAYTESELQSISTNTLDSLQKSLVEQTKNHHQQWQEAFRHWKKNLLINLTAHDLALTELEINSFQEQETLSALLNRFIDLHLEYEKPEQYDASNYLRLKTQLIIHSSLSRRHEPHEAHEIHQFFKKLKKDFKMINEEAKELVRRQEAETKDLIEPIAAVAKKLRSSLKK